jgi:metal-responsive CopG/Arc/MetJ family transcriptional regulator
MNGKLVRVNVTLRKDLLEKVDEYAKKKYEDRSTAMRQLVSLGLQEGNKKDVAYAYKNKTITLREAAELLGTEYYETQDILAEEGVPVTDLTEGEIVERKKKGLKDKY